MGTSEGRAQAAAASPSGAQPTPVLYKVTFVPSALEEGRGLLPRRLRGCRARRARLSPQFISISLSQLWDRTPQTLVPEHTAVCHLLPGRPQSSLQVWRGPPLVGSQPRAAP